MAVERIPHSFFIAKAARLRDLTDITSRVFQHSPRGLDAKHLDGCCRGATDLALIHAGEIARAHLRSSGQYFD